MDLYIQIGVIFVLITAFAAFTYVIGMPAKDFQRGSSEAYNEASSIINSKAERGLLAFDNRTDVSAADVINTVKSSKDNGFIVGVSSRSLPALITLYGQYYTGENNLATNRMYMRGVSLGTSEHTGLYTLAKASDLTPTNSPGVPTAEVTIAAANLRSMSFFSFRTGAVSLFEDSKKTSGLTLALEDISKSTTTSSSIDQLSAFTSSNNITKTGRFYTASVPGDTTNRSPKPYKIHLEDKSHVTYIDPSWVYNSFLIEDVKGNIVGVIFEDTAIETQYSLAELVTRIKGGQ